MKKILETERTILRELSYADYEDLAEILRCPRTMYAYEHGFSHAEVRAWLERQLERYAADGFGLWAVVDRLSGTFLGQCGLSIQEVDGVGELEVGYLFNRRFWHRGYATEAALACRDYAVRVLGRDRVVCTVRDTNLASRRVAERLGMRVEKRFIKHYYNMDMPHLLYVWRRSR